ncbi:MAG: dihydrolipoyllysine-residue succinyltransferase [Crocinitomicaceae bacterium]|nr:dihydrolipoyllysine-residue succinyltransferase [Crocinitomicaceae bacterium]|tara:strand:+ start:934 stop:2226 length:1293 start_codon:yes stop_codon:yes gene_type:complete
MPILEMKVPSPGESISEVEIAAWLVNDGDYVEKDQPIAEVDSDKATLELPAEMAGVITLKVEEGDVVPVGDVCCLIDTDAKRPAGMDKPAEVPAPSEPADDPVPVTPAVTPSVKPPEKPVVAPVSKKNYAEGSPSPAAKKMMADKGISSGSILGSGRDGRVLKQDVISALAAGFDPSSASAQGGWTGSREVRSERMSMLRRKVAERLVGVKNETAMLTTFNEVDMKPIMDLRAKYKIKFKEEKGVGLGFMGFFTKAVTTALAAYPGVNAMIDGKEVLYHDYVDVCIAVSSPKGLMVPVVRNAEVMSIAEIEGEIKRLAIRARDGVLTVDEMQGGTFTITNGGVFGSMLSTPIINPPQSAILGMHNIVERPVAIDGQVVIRPIMYVALSYDHRIVDGKESVSFLYLVKQLLENPERMLFGGKQPEEILLGL